MTWLAWALLVAVALCAAEACLDRSPATVSAWTVAMIVFGAIYLCGMHGHLLAVPAAAVVGGFLGSVLGAVTAWAPQGPTE